MTRESGSEWGNKMRLQRCVKLIRETSPFELWTLWRWLPSNLPWEAQSKSWASLAQAVYDSRLCHADIRIAYHATIVHWVQQSNIAPRVRVFLLVACKALEPEVHLRECGALLGTSYGVHWQPHADVAGKWLSRQSCSPRRKCLCIAHAMLIIRVTWNKP